MKNSLRRLRNLLGLTRGYGACERCGDTWDHKRGYSISYARGSGMFPLCEECWKETTVEEKRRYVKQLVDYWRSIPTSTPGTLNGQTFESILENVYKAIEWEGKGVNSSHIFNSEPLYSYGLGVSYEVCSNHDCEWHKTDKRFRWASQEEFIEAATKTYGATSPQAQSHSAQWVLLPEYLTK